jgi:hypothetical protein
MPHKLQTEKSQDVSYKSVFIASFAGMFSTDFRIVLLYHTIAGKCMIDA